MTTNRFSEHRDTDLNLTDAEIDRRLEREEIMAERWHDQEQDRRAEELEISHDIRGG